MSEDLKGTEIVPIVKQEGIVPLTHFAAPTNIEDLQTIAAFMVKSGFFKDVKDVAQAVMKIIAGAELGIGPVQSQKVVYFVKGSPGYAANFIAAQIKRNPNYNYKIMAHTDQGCEIAFYERDLMGTSKFVEVGRSIFNKEDATRAGLLGPNAYAWKQYPRSMYFSRALTQGARLYCPDAFGAAPVYTREELTTGTEAIDGAFIEIDDIEEVPEDLQTSETPETGAGAAPEAVAEALEEAIQEPVVATQVVDELKPWTDKQLSVEDARNVLYAIAIEDWGYESLGMVRKTLIDAHKWTGTPPIPDHATLDEVATYLLAKSPETPS
jgi:hypothetical protein